MRMHDPVFIRFDDAADTDELRSQLTAHIRTRRRGPMGPTRRLFQLAPRLCIKDRSMPAASNCGLQIRDSVIAFRPRPARRNRTPDDSAR